MRRYLTSFVRLSVMTIQVSMLGTLSVVKALCRSLIPVWHAIVLLSVRGLRCYIISSGLVSIYYTSWTTLLSMMLPDHQERDFLACTYGQSDEAQDRLWDTEKPQLLTGLFPEWVHDPSPMRDLPDNLPPRLNDILRRCKVEEWDDQWDDGYNETEIGWWPFAVICWHGFEPYQDRRTKRMVRWNFDFGNPDARQRELDSRIPDMSQGGDISWMVLDNLIKSNENYIHCTCMPTVHTFDAAENLLYAFSPFYELLKYISHDQD